MYLLFNMVIFQPLMLVFRGVVTGAYLEGVYHETFLHLPFPPSPPRLVDKAAAKDKAVWCPSWDPSQTHQWYIYLYSLYIYIYIPRTQMGPPVLIGKKTLFWIVLEGFEAQNIEDTQVPGM